MAALAAAIGYFVCASLPALSQADSSGRDEIILVCGKCRQELRITAIEFGMLRSDWSSFALPQVRRRRSRSGVAALRRVPSCRPTATAGNRKPYPNCPATRPAGARNSTPGYSI